MSTVPTATPINLIDPNDLIPSFAKTGRCIRLHRPAAGPFKISPRLPRSAILLRRFGLFDDTHWEGLGGAISKNSSPSKERHDKPTQTSRTICGP